MPGRSRLGKGLGALFPTINDEGLTEDVSRETLEEDLSVEEKNKKPQAQKSKKKSSRATMPSVEISSPYSDEEERPEIPSLENSIPRYESTAALDALLSSTEGASVISGLKPVHGAYLTEIKLDDIVANEHQPRQIFDEDDLLELSNSIKEVGVLQPIVVREVDSNTHDGHHYELIMGERRTRASRLAGLEKIPAIVKTTDDTEMLRDALLENLHRVALNPLEEAAAYQQMLKEFGLTQEQLAQSVSKSRPQITNTLRLLQLPGSVQKKVAAGVLSAGHARALLSLESAEDMESLANRIIAEGLSVRSTEELVAMKNGTGEKKKTRAVRVNPWENSDLVMRLENRFDTRVAIKGTAKRGRIEITFTSQEDLDRILNVLNQENSSTSDGWM
ncbi:ParB/RepB/Spo0J family partition protein [Alloscardovia theropitheci]|uniref:ParB/RepB/Spo0J family partition protein n=1 Tax=Alloscardovia theropitheci TaxID=2496842 RepID=A0A4V2MTY4_9BIFI|nr:ParB/RepB/Spo0J family partition protein [Alloscardovia theropitheci]TCD54289.1 ParB/RepB/Spo0J family partition protein [Alloscardovia theropitheci]